MSQALQAYKKRVMARSPAAERVIRELEERGGWRGLFDPFADEWTWTSLPEKRRVLDGLRQAGCNLSRLLRAYRSEWHDRGRLDVAAAAGLALSELDDQAGPAGPVWLAWLRAQVGEPAPAPPMRAVVCGGSRRAGGAREE